MKKRGNRFEVVVRLIFRQSTPLSCYAGCVRYCISLYVAPSREDAPSPSGVSPGNAQMVAQFHHLILLRRHSVICLGFFSYHLQFRRFYFSCIVWQVLGSVNSEDEYSPTSFVPYQFFQPIVCEKIAARNTSLACFAFSLYGPL